jgi:hypothetical protein
MKVTPKTEPLAALEAEWQNLNMGNNRVIVIWLNM